MKLSVIIPAWRAEKYIAQAIASVKKQRWDGEKEIIVCDDGSDDNTASIALAEGAFLLSKNRSGAASARNMALNAAKGDYILFLDSDDILVEEGLEMLWAPMRKDSSIMAVFGRAQDFVSEELTGEEMAGLKPRDGAYGGVLPGCSLIKKEVFDLIGVFDESLKSGETVGWMMKLRESKIPVANIDDVVLKRRLHLTNTGRLNPQEEMKNYALLLRERMKKR